MKAYDLMARFEPGKVAKPPTVYRALQRLVQDGLAHRVLSLDAYTACRLPASDHQPAFLICRACRRTTEIAQGGYLRTDLERAGDGFVAEAVVLEAVGVCTACR